MNKQLLVFSLDDRNFGLHIEQVERVVRAVDATPLPQAPAIVMGVIDVQGRIIPLLNVRARFGHSTKEIHPDDHFIIAFTTKLTVALAVDHVRDIINLPAESMVASKEVLGAMDQVQGIVQLADGLVLIHDLDRFLRLDEENALELALQGRARDGE